MSKKTKKATEGPSRGVPDPRRFGCISYHVGHHVHWIQAMHSANSESLHVAGSEPAPTPTWSGKVVSIEGEVLTVRKSDGSLSRFRHHDPVRLEFVVEHMGVDVTVNERWSILRAGFTGGGSFCFSVQSDRGLLLGPCLTRDV
jgi:hypothetical protein